MSTSSLLTPIKRYAYICTIVDTNMLPQNLKALLSLFTNASSMIIGFMLCAKLNTNSCLLVFGLSHPSQVVQKHDKKSLSTGTIAS